MLSLRLFIDSIWYQTQDVTLYNTSILKIIVILINRYWIPLVKTYNHDIQWIFIWFPSFFSSLSKILTVKIFIYL